MKTLYLVRHAKSSWKDASSGDMQRPLNKRGFKNAPVMAERLHKTEPDIGLIITSPANRARTTAQFMATGTGYDPDNIRTNEQLYFGGIHSMLGIIDNADPSIQSLMLVGHNPDMTSLFNYLCGFQTDNMPTCAIATIQFYTDWADISRESGVVANYDFPKKSIRA